MAKKETSEDVKILKTKLIEGKVIVGKDQVVKGLKTGNKQIERVLLAKNVPELIKEDIMHYASLAEIPVSIIEQDNEEFGIVLKKNFFVTVVAIIKWIGWLD